MKLLYDFFPVILFFVVYKFYGAIPPDAIHAINPLLPLTLVPGQHSDAIFLATAVAIVASFLQVGFYWVRHRRAETMHLVSLALITLFGGATLVLHNPEFIKWKPTAINWLFGIAFLGSQFIGRKTLVERIMSHAITVPHSIWRRLNIGWVVFFFVSGALNIWVAYQFSQEIWVDFKLFGLLGLSVVFIIAQAFYLARFMQEPPTKEEP
ncbi:septation protein A [Acidihalobacter ferrooxydans]|uniref:Inner membrane-spanning protein YciB n=1 Tax=Acidihalobacter ferrooxydans TaxID=1765967 RepID=A0A1P8UGA1_9GAMM|nr:septation protein A [Acidihalobacter ferrooxydans]APZ42872.1 septation protein A [Acidihalobacter ferrooxydans]